MDVLVPAAVTLLASPAEGGRTARADRAHRLTLCCRGAMGTEKALTAVAHDRAEIALGRGHGSPLWSWQQAGDDLIERTDDFPQRLWRDVHVGLGGVDVRVTEQHLNHTRARPLFDQMRGI